MIALQQRHAEAEGAARHSLEVSGAGTSWDLLMQAGPFLDCLTGIPLSRLLREELALPPEKLARIDVLLLDGMPVDQPDSALAISGARLALAAGLPGVAGLAMKSNSAVRGLRPGITFLAGEQAAATPGPGRIELALFSLALPLLAGHVLAKGPLLPAGKLLRYLRPEMRGECRFDGSPADIPALRATLRALPPDSLISVTALQDA
jgi:hypothetical protein